jgi:hypothetical protein
MSCTTGAAEPAAAEASDVFEIFQRAWVSFSTSVGKSRSY